MNLNCYLEIFNHLIAIFSSAFRNLSESVIKSHITTKDQVEYYFNMIGPIAVLFKEVKHKIGSNKERLDAIAQVIAECIGQAYILLMLNFKLQLIIFYYYSL